MSNTHRDYVPHSAAQFLAFMERLIMHAEKQVEGAKPAWPGVPFERLEAVTVRFAVFRDAFEAALTVPT